MVSMLGRWPVVLFLGLLCPAVSVGQQVRGPSEPSTAPPQGARVKAQNGDTIVIEGEDQVRVVRRRPAFVRLVADADRAMVVVVAEYLKAASDTPTGLSDRWFAFYDIKGQSEWPLPPRWEGPAWLEEYNGSTTKESRPFLGVETPAGDIAFGEADPAMPHPLPRPTTVVRFQSVTMGGHKQSFDVAEQETLATVAKSKARQPTRK